MDKLEFIAELGKRLQGLPQEDIEKSIDFYVEMIDERVEDGMSEAEAIAAIGTPAQIASQIWSDVPLRKAVKARVPHKSLGVGMMILLVLGSPIWLSLLIAALAVLFAVYVSIWAVAVSLWAVVVTFAACAVAGVLSGVVYLVQANAGGGLFLLGCGILLVGLSIFAYYGCLYICKWLAIASKQFIIWLKRTLMKRRDV